MFSVRGFNEAIELWGVLFCAIGIVCVLLFSRVDGRYRNLFVAAFSAEIVASGGDALAGLFRGQEGMLATVMVHVGNHATFIGNFLLIGALTWYLCERIEEAGGSGYWPWRTTVLCLTGVMCLFTLIGVFFTIDEGNLYQRTDWYWLATAYVAVVDAANAGITIYNRARIEPSTLACLLFYTLMPVLAAVVQAFVYGPNFVIVAGVLGLIVVLFEMQQHASRVFVERTEELARSRVEVSESRIAVMVSQIQPHFLFNTLDTIYGLVDEDADKAQEAIDSFSRYLRTNLDSLKHASPVPITREMEHVRTYLELERMSDESRLDYEFDIQATDFLVPALSVQTLAENAVKHGLGGREKGGRVIVRTREQATEFTVAIIDDGVGFDGVSEALQGASGGVGIANTRARLEAMCGGELEVYSEPGVGTTAIIHVPKQLEGSLRL